MNTITIKGFVYADKRYDGTIQCAIWPRDDMTATIWGACCGPIEVEYRLPEGFSIETEMLRQEIASLKKQREEAGAEFARTVREIDEKLSKLQAIEFKPSEVAA